MYTDYKNYQHLKKLPDEIEEAIDKLEDSKEFSKGEVSDSQVNESVKDPTQNRNNLKKVDKEISVSSENKSENANREGDSNIKAENDSDIESEMRVVDLYRRDGDKLAENWIFIDHLHFLKKLGVDLLERAKFLNQ